MHIVITYRHGEDRQYIDLIGMAFTSAHRFGYETVLISDRNIPGADHFILQAAEEEPRLMNWILAAQHRYLCSPEFNDDSVFFSPDALIVKPLQPIFQGGFDVAFTNRDNARWPINNGVIFLKWKGKERLQAYWNALRGICKEYPAATQDWYGDQQALQDAIDLGLPALHRVNVELLPCAQYNASPAQSEGLDTNLLESAYIIHLKGKRKNMMKRYSEFLCGTI